MFCLRFAGRKSAGKRQISRFLDHFLSCAAKPRRKMMFSLQARFAYLLCSGCQKCFLTSCALPFFREGLFFLFDAPDFLRPVTEPPIHSASCAHGSFLRPAASENPDEHAADSAASLSGRTKNEPLSQSLHLNQRLLILFCLKLRRNRPYLSVLYIPCFSLDRYFSDAIIKSINATTKDE